MVIGSQTLDPRGATVLELHYRCPTTWASLASNLSKVKCWFLNIVLMSYKKIKTLYLSNYLSLQTNINRIFIFQCNFPLSSNTYSFIPQCDQGLIQVDTSFIILQMSALPLHPILGFKLANFSSSLRWHNIETHSMIILGKRCHSTLAFQDVSPTLPTTHEFSRQHEGNKGVTHVITKSTLDRLLIRKTLSNYFKPNFG